MKAKLNKIARQNARFDAAHDRYATPSHELSKDDLRVRIRLLMHTAYEMAERDVRERNKRLHNFTPKRNTICRGCGFTRGTYACTEICGV